MWSVNWVQKTPVRVFTDVMYTVCCPQHLPLRATVSYSLHTPSNVSLLPICYSPLLLALFLSSLPLHISSPLLLFVRSFYMLSACFHLIFFVYSSYTLYNSKNTANWRDQNYITEIFEANHWFPRKLLWNFCQ